MYCRSRFTTLRSISGAQESTPERKALHYRLLSLEPGETPLDARAAARRLIEGLLPKAFRRPVSAAEIDKYIALYDRVAKRDDPYEERVKLALKAVLVAPEFLFHLTSGSSEEPGMRRLTNYEGCCPAFLFPVVDDAGR
jgi:hypothetical protein